MLWFEFWVTVYQHILLVLDYHNTYVQLCKWCLFRVDAKLYFCIDIFLASMLRFEFWATVYQHILLVPDYHNTCYVQLLKWCLFSWYQVILLQISFLKVCCGLNSEQLCNNNVQACTEGGSNDPPPKNFWKSIFSVTILFIELYLQSKK